MVEGTQGDDAFEAGNGDDEINGGAGDDRLYGNDGDDVLHGGAGIDHIDGGAGDDRIFDDDGGYWTRSSASIFGGEGHDVVTAANGYFFISGGEGNDRITLTGAAPDSSVDGEGGDDVVHVEANRRFEAFGGDGDDLIVSTGTGGGLLSGDKGDDVIDGGAGDDVIDGWEGHDVAIFDGAFRRSTLTFGYEGEIVVDGSGGPDGYDVTYDLEELRFVDGSYVIDPDSPGAQVQRMYDTVLGRAPDAAGLDYWVDRLEDGASLAQVASALASSPEFQQATGGLGNAAFVDYVYEHALGRAPDDAGRAYWVAQLDGGYSRGDLLVGFSESAEHRAATADLTGQGYFQTGDTAQAIALLFDSATGSMPDLDGLTYWLDQVEGGRTLGQVAQALATSPEFAGTTKGMTNAQLVDHMYRETLDRAPDAGGLAYWTGLLDAGLTRGDLLLHFAQSAEHASLLSGQIVGGIDVLM